MDDGEHVYGVLRRLYGDSQLKAARSICEEERYHRGESSLQRAGKKQRIYRIIHRLSVLNLAALAEEAKKEEVRNEELEVIIADLKAKGLIYEPEPGIVSCAME